MGDIHFFFSSVFFFPNFFIFILRRKNTGKKENFVKYRKIWNSVKIRNSYILALGPNSFQIQNHQSLMSQEFAWVIKYTPHWYHMYTTWVLHVHHIGITCKPHWYHRHNTLVSHEHNMGITCSPRWYHMQTTLVSQVHNMGITCSPHWYYMQTTLVSHVHIMGITCSPNWYHRHTTWVSQAHHKGITGTQHVHYMWHLQHKVPYCPCYKLLVWYE